MSIVKPNLTYTQIIAFGFLAIIFIGSILLCLPISSRTGTFTPYIDALFTATSATCVTGLVVFDTFTHWSIFGQIIILLLIQIGGVGFMTIIALFSLLLKRQISLHERKLLMQSAGTMNVGGVVKLIKRVAIGTFCFEGIGALLLSIRFIPEMGFVRGLYNAVFHSISAFCNAGFDIMGKYDPSSSLTRYVNDPIINITIMSLIVIGGLGFFVWNDLFQCKLRFKELMLHSKLVLSVSAFLIIVGTILFFFFEGDGNFADMNFGERLLASAFQSITPRTAGFNTIDMSALSESSNLLTLFLMFVGGSPGSTAGGIKTTTFMVLILGAIATSRHSVNITAYKRRLDEDIVRRASSITAIYLVAIFVATMVICFIEPVTLKDALFEVVSAAGTVGLSTGMTPHVGALTQIILIILMYGGRVGGLSLALVLAEKRTYVPLERPVEKIMIG